MMQSPEWPDLPFVRPRAFGNGRDGRSVKLIVIHYTAGSERSTSAEDGAAYDARRTDGTSCHYFHDQNSTVQCVLTKDRANSALAKGNRLGIQHELCGTAQSREQWLDAASDGTLWRAAKQAARDAQKYGLPVRRLTDAEVRATWYSNGPGGFCGHDNITRAFPEDGGNHLDPGLGFPWDIFLACVRSIQTGETMADKSIDDVIAFLANVIERGNLWPMAAQLKTLTTAVAAIGSKVEIDPAELAAITAAAQAGVTAAFSDERLDALAERVARTSDVATVKAALTEFYTQGIDGPSTPE